jgi:hypothetical protein
MQLSLHQILRNSHMLNDAKYNYFLGNFTQIGQEMWKRRIEILLSS